MAQKMVHLRGVGVQYSPSRYALRDVSFDLGRGEFAYITGANGAGKTTLLKILFAMERPSAGNIYVNNREVSTLPKNQIYQYRREVGFVFQDFKLLPDLTIYDNVALPLEIRKMTPGEVDHRVRGFSPWLVWEIEPTIIPRCFLEENNNEFLLLAQLLVALPFY